MHAVPYSGGFKGFDKTIWEVAEYNKGGNPSITFKYYSKDGEEGTVAVNYSEHLFCIIAVI
jgi:aldose 1-epimerase